MGGTELSVAEIQHWSWNVGEKKIKIKHTHSFTPHIEISCLLIMYREDLVLSKERIVISTISMQTSSRIASGSNVLRFLGGSKML